MVDFVRLLCTLVVMRDCGGPDVLLVGVAVCAGVVLALVIVGCQLDQAGLVVLGDGAGFLVLSTAHFY